MSVEISLRIRSTRGEDLKPTSVLPSKLLKLIEPFEKALLVASSELDGFIDETTPIISLANLEEGSINNIFIAQSRAVEASIYMDECITGKRLLSFELNHAMQEVKKSAKSNGISYALSSSSLIGNPNILYIDEETKIVEKETKILQSKTKIKGHVYEINFKEVPGRATMLSTGNEKIKLKNISENNIQTIHTSLAKNLYTTFCVTGVGKWDMISYTLIELSVRNITPLSISNKTVIELLQKSEFDIDQFNSTNEG